MKDTIAELKRLVCHDDQMVIWQGELLAEFQEYIRDDITGPDVDNLHAIAKRAIENMADAILSQPELTSLLAAAEAGEKLRAENERLRDIEKALLPSGWRGWTGGDQAPDDADIIGERAMIRRRDGVIIGQIVSRIDWTWLGLPTDVIAYESRAALASTDNGGGT